MKNLNSLSPGALVDYVYTTFNKTLVDYLKDKGLEIKAPSPSPSPSPVPNLVDMVDKKIKK